MFSNEKVYLFKSAPFISVFDNNLFITLCILDFQRPVPDRGWGYAAVRVCKPCYNMTADERIEGGVSNNEPNEVQVRKVGETVYGTVSSLATAFEFPINIIKDSARFFSDKSSYNYLFYTNYFSGQIIGFLIVKLLSAQFVIKTSETICQQVSQVLAHRTRAPVSIIAGNVARSGLSSLNCNFKKQSDQKAIFLCIRLVDTKTTWLTLSIVIISI